MRSGGFAGIATAAALLAAAPSALAETFCVEKPSCNGTNQVTLQDAINVAGQTQGIPDRIELGKATFEEGPYLAADDNPVKIIGSGRAKTTLARSTSTASETVLSLDDPDSSVASLAVDLGDGNSVIGMITKGKASDVLVESTSASTNQIGVRLVNGSLKQSSIRLSNSTGNIGLNTIGLSTASNLSTHATTGIYGSGEIERARVTAVNNGITGIMDLEIDQATIEVTGTGSTALVGAGGLGFDAETTTARHVTMVADPTDGATGANVQAAPGISSSSTANLVLRNSIIWGFATDLLRHGSNGGGCPPFCATPGNIDIAWTLYDPTKTSESGPGEFTIGKGNVSKNPKFAKPGAGDYRLKASSPLIDKGQKSKPAAGESRVDLDGRKRVVDGDGDGKKRRDIGAFERPQP